MTEPAEAPSAPMSLYVSAGRSFRERDLRISRSTAQYLNAGKKRAREQAFKAIDRFENRLGLDRLGSAPHASRAAMGMGQQNMSAPNLSHPPGRSKGRRSSEEEEEEEKKKAEHLNSSPKLVRRPVTPIDMYDYGQINLRSVSVEALNPHPRREIRAGESFCTAPFGSYPSTVQEPIFMRPRQPWEPTTPFDGLIDTPPLTRALSDKALLGTLSRQGLGLGKHAQHKVRNNRAHRRRAEIYVKCLANKEMEAQLEDQQGWDGRHGYGWRDRCDDHLKWLDKNGGRVDPNEYLRNPPETWTDTQKLAYRVLSGIHEHCKARRTRVRDIFRLIDKNGSGILEPEEFLQGLRNSRVGGADTLTVQDLLRIFCVVDENCDGSISLPELDRAMLQVGKARAPDPTRGLSDNSGSFWAKKRSSLPE